MQFEDFDKKIIDAAEHHHPAYEEKAWEKMEMLLDKHMPVKKDDRRRIIFFLFLFLSLGSGAFLLFRDNSKTKTPVTIQQASDSKKASGSSIASDLQTNNPEKTEPTANETAVKEVAASGNKNSNPESIEKAKSIPANDVITNSVTGNANKIKTENSGSAKEIAPAFNSTEKSKVIADKNRNNKKISSANSPENKSAGDVSANSIVGDNKQKNTTVGSDIVSDAAPVKQETNQKIVAPAIGDAVDTSSQKKYDKQNIKPEEKNSAVAAKKESKKPGKQKQFPLAFTFSAGPDLSFISLSQLGKVTMRYGAGLSYTFNRFTLRSGFYVSKKIYSAEGYNYHPFYPNLEKVDGDCKVFEIPLTVNYNFAQRKNYNWFASTGLSSYLMKRETYDYLSKDPATGMSNYYSWTWNNKNKHYFSVLNLSAGYERKFTKAISVIAEPYLQIPLTGIGNGKMKLNSGGILFTLSVKPFSGKK